MSTAVVPSTSMRPQSAHPSSAATTRHNDIAQRAQRNVEKLIAPVSTTEKRHAAAEAKRAHEQGRTHSAHGGRPGEGHTAANGKKVGHRAAWCFFAPSSNRAVEGAHPQKSCYLMTAAIHDHNKALPSAKTPAAILPPSDPRFAKVLPRDVHGDCDLLTPLDREQWTGVQHLRQTFAPLNESTIAQRRTKDQSHHTLDNGYRQFVEKGTQRPLVARVIEGEFYHVPLVKKPKPFSYVASNRRNVLVASAVNYHARSGSSLR